MLMAMKKTTLSPIQTQALHLVKQAIAGDIKMSDGVERAVLALRKLLTSHGPIQCEDNDPGTCGNEDVRSKPDEK